MFFYNIMASHKTNKRSYKKRTPKRKTQKGGDINILGYTCKKDEENNENNSKESVTTPDDNTPDDNTTESVTTPDEEEDEDEEGNEEEDDTDDKEQRGMGKKGRKGRKSTKKRKNVHKKKGKTMKKKSAWTTFVSELYKKNKKTNPLYMFKNALKDAAKIYKK